MNLQDLRRSRGLSQEQLAHEADIDRGYVGKVENARYSVSTDLIERLAKALKVDPVTLLKPRD